MLHDKNALKIINVLQLHFEHLLSNKDSIITKLNCFTAVNKIESIRYLRFANCGQIAIMLPFYQFYTTSLYLENFTVLQISKSTCCQSRDKITNCYLYFGNPPNIGKLHTRKIHFRCVIHKKFVNQFFSHS